MLRNIWRWSFMLELIVALQPPEHQHRGTQRYVRRPRQGAKPAVKALEFWFNRIED
jgi:hypothetical protein